MAEERLEQVLTDRYKYSTVQYKYITSTLQVQVQDDGEHLSRRPVSSHLQQRRLQGRDGLPVLQHLSLQGQAAVRPDGTDSVRVEEELLLQVGAQYSTVQYSTIQGTTPSGGS